MSQPALSAIFSYGKSIRAVPNGREFLAEHYV